MKNKFLKCLIAVICAMFLISCYVDPPHRGSRIEIKGTITDEVTGLPLQSVFVCIDTMYLDLDINETTSYEDGVFSNQEGKYFITYTQGSLMAFRSWPSELFLVAIDTSNVYETQKMAFPVTIQHSENPRLKSYSYAFVTADFVMKKK